ncbi:MAG: aminoacyltransferase [Clostridiales bacterium]|nr:aminoacyltransferase [Clostridiales bacterium]
MQKELYDFMRLNKAGSFMQSDCWCHVKDNWINERIVLRDSQGDITACMLVLIKKMPVFNTAFMYSPRGPICDFGNTSVLNALLEEVKKLQKKYNAFMLKTDPAFESGDSAAAELINLGFRYASDKVGYQNVQCRENYILELEGKTEDEIFAQFKSKYRYNIRLALKKGVVCRHYGAERVDEFFELLQETAARDGFKIRQKAYYVKMLSAFGNHGRLYLCHLGDIPLSGAVVVNYAGKTHYVYGASSSQYRDYMPNYLMQWEIIKWALETECTLYSFEGIPYYDDENHPNYGVYRFKRGFNGRVLNFAGEFDYVFKPAVFKTVNSFLKMMGKKTL